MKGTSPSTALGRVGAIFRARLANRRKGEAFPVAAIVAQAFVAAVLCGLVEDRLPPFGYALFALTISGGLVAIPLLGDLGYLLRRDEAAEWVGALPARPIELQIARTLHLLTVLLVLALGALGPAVFLAPGGATALLFAGWAQVLAIAAALVLAQSLLGGRSEPLLIAAQTVLVIGAVLGLALGLRAVPMLAELHAFADLRPIVRCMPPSWFAAAVAGSELPLSALAWALGGASLVLLFVTPAPSSTVSRSTPFGDRLLAPARALARRFWLRREERAGFELVFDALPRERDVVLRTYPMIGLPLAFLIAGSTEADPVKREGLLALLSFSPGLYLPLLISQVPASTSHAARWLIDGAPVRYAELHGGAIKALAVRFLLPLYTVLFVLTSQLANVDLAMRLTLPGAFASMLVMRLAYPALVDEPPLSVAPEAIRIRDSIGEGLLVLTVIVTVGAIVAWKFLTTPLLGVVAAMAFLAADAVVARRWRNDPAM